MTPSPSPPQTIQKYFLLGVVVVLLVLFSQFISPFLPTIFIAAILVTVIYPIHRLIKNTVRFSHSVAALITVLLVFLLFLVPITFFFIAMVNQASTAYTEVSIRLSDIFTAQKSVLSLLDGFPKAQGVVESLLDKNPISLESLAETLTQGIRAFSHFLLQQTTNIIKQVSLFVLHILIFLLALFYFVKDGPKIVQYIQSLLPISKKYNQELFKKIDNLLNSIMIGMFGGALAQGIVLGIGLWIVGFENAIFWASIGALLSPVPYVGAGIVWIPISLSLVLSGNIWQGVFMLIWGAVAIAQVDNLVKPYLIGARSTLHPFAIMVMILGGALTFGFKGIIFAPFVLMLTLAFLHIYSLEFAPSLPIKFRVPVKKHSPKKKKTPQKKAPLLQHEKKHKKSR